MTSKELAINFCRNAVDYAKEGCGIGELERKLGYNKGYFSRKAKNCGEIPLNKALECAELLQKDIKELIYEDRSEIVRKRRIAELEKELRELKNGGTEETLCCSER